MTTDRYTLQVLVPDGPYWVWATVAALCSYEVCRALAKRESGITRIVKARA